MKRKIARKLYNEAAGVENHLAATDDPYAAQRVGNAIDALWELRKENQRLKRTLRGVRQCCKQAAKTSDDISAMMAITRIVRK